MGRSEIQKKSQKIHQIMKLGMNIHKRSHKCKSLCVSVLSVFIIWCGGRLNFSLVELMLVEKRMKPQNSAS